jgi:hypothetical protein
VSSYFEKEKKNTSAAHLTAPPQNYTEVLTVFPGAGSLAPQKNISHRFTSKRSHRAPIPIPTDPAMAMPIEELATDAAGAPDRGHQSAARPSTRARTQYCYLAPTPMH